MQEFDDLVSKKSISMSTYSHERITLSSTSVSVMSDPASRGSDETTTRARCSPPRSQKRRPLALAVGFNPLEDADGRTVVITKSAPRPLTIETSPSFRSHVSRASLPALPKTKHRFRPLPVPAACPESVPESVPYLPELGPIETSKVPQDE